MTKKDFKLLAEVIRKTREERESNEALNELSFLKGLLMLKLAENNKRFCLEKFIEATMTEREREQERLRQEEDNGLFRERVEQLKGKMMKDTEEYKSC